MSYWEELKKNAKSIYQDRRSLDSTIVPLERMTYAVTTRVNQGARYGDKMVVDPLADQVTINHDPIVLKELAERLGVMTLRNDVIANRGGGILVCGSPNEVKPDPHLDDYFDVSRLF